QTYFLKDSNVWTISGETGPHNVPLSKSVKAFVVTISSMFISFILLMFITFVLGAFVKIIGINNTFTLAHFNNQTGWNSLSMCLYVSFISAILPAAIGILQCFLFARTPIPGKKLFEFLTLFGLAVPGTVMG